MFTEEQINRYSRHIILKEVGGKGQQKLLDGRVLIVGAGGLGSPAALYLAAAGVGKIGLVDADSVDITNLQRQIIHHTADIGRRKVESAANKIREINPDVEVETFPLWLNAENAEKIFRDYDFIIDGVDNFAAKFLVNDAAVLAGKPFSHAGILQFEGQTITIVPGEGPCYRCIFPKPPPPEAIPTCSQAGVIGVLPGIVGSIQATEAVKYILGIGDLLVGRLLTFNALRMAFREIKIPRASKCPICGDRPTITEVRDEEGALNACQMETR